MVIKLICVFLECQCNVYVIPKSIGRKDLGYKGYEPNAIANFLALLVLLCLLDLYLLPFSVSSAVVSLPACLRFSNMNTFAVDSFPACLRFSNMNTLQSIHFLRASYLVLWICVLVLSLLRGIRAQFWGFVASAIYWLCIFLRLFLHHCLPFRGTFLLAGMLYVIEVCRWPLYLMRVIWMHSNTLLITLALRCLITDQLPLHQLPVLSFRLTCVSCQLLFNALPPISCPSRATTLWIFLCILETPTVDMLHATWLLQAIAAAQSFKPSDLVRYVAPLTLVVQNFESVWGTSPIVLVQNTLT
jgi:hypothetical protein